jgi:hypothetical protein
MATHEPSLKIVHAFLEPETRKALALPLPALIELTNRVYDSVFQRSPPVAPR